MVTIFRFDHMIGENQQYTGSTNTRVNTVFVKLWVQTYQTAFSSTWVSRKRQILHTELTGYCKSLYVVNCRYGSFTWDTHVRGGFSNSFVTCKSWFPLVAEIWQKNKELCLEPIPIYVCNINTNSIKTKHVTSQSREDAIFICCAEKYWVNVCTGNLCKNYRIYPCTSRSCV